MVSGRSLPEALGDLITVVGSDGSLAMVSPHGGHVVSWCTADGFERLFVSDRATTAGGMAIRGGIPVCFPQFAGLGPLPKHGFARTSTWTAVGPCSFALEVAPDAWAGWPHHCSLILDVLLGPATLTTMLHVVNRGGEAFSFTGALHTYLACRDVTTVAVSGLDGLATHGGGRVKGDITFGDGVADVDLSVLHPHGAVVVRGLDGAGEGTMVCAQTGFQDVVVWNIGAAMGASMGDLGAGQWHEYVCVEAAAVNDPVVVESGASWIGSQTLVVT
jgi:glucose-6-phosphate 1-epimerase